MQSSNPELVRLIAPTDQIAVDLCMDWIVQCFASLPTQYGLYGRQRPMPAQLFPDDSQLPDLGISGDSNLWPDGYSYRQDNR